MFDAKRWGSSVEVSSFLSTERCGLAQRTNWLGKEICTRRVKSYFFSLFFAPGGPRAGRLPATTQPGIGPWLKKKPPANCILFSREATEPCRQ